MDVFYYFVKPENMIYRKEERLYVQPDDNFLIINNRDHTNLFDTRYWIPPPFSSIYKNDILEHEKPLLVIHNKYNIEWDIGPINFIDVPTLDKILSIICDKYQVIYIRPININNKLTEKGFSIDHNLILNEFGDYDLVKEKYPNVLLFNDLLDNNNYSYNELLVKIYSDCTSYISVQGGNSYFISYFAKKMVIYHKAGSEISGQHNVYEGWYKHTNKYEKEILVTNDYNILVDNIKKLYV